MKKRKLSNKAIALLAAAVVLMAGGAYKGTMAVLNIYSPDHLLQFKTDNQAVEIWENGQSSETLLTSLAGKIQPGKANKEEISAKNTTTDSPQFVRIIVRKYWAKEDENGNNIKQYAAEDEEFLPDLDMIKLGLANTDVWQINKAETTSERTVYYYKNVVQPQEVTKALTSTITIDKSVASTATVTGPDEDGVITYTYDYDGYKVCLEAEAQSIQTHNAADAVKSIWGVQNVTATETTLTVNN